MNSTVDAFLGENNLTPVLSKKILKNLKSKECHEMIFNLTQLNLDFLNESATISYYILDENYPNLSISFTELESLLQSFRVY